MVRRFQWGILEKEDQDRLLPYTPRCTANSGKGSRAVLYLFWLTDIYVGPEDGGVIAILISRERRIDEMVVWVFRSIVLCNYQSNGKEPAKRTKSSEHGCRLGLTGQRRREKAIKETEDTTRPGAQAPSTQSTASDY
jgi:hypothetical protein